MRKVLILKSGSTSAPVRVAHGDYDRWFAAALSGCGCICHVVDAERRAKLPPDPCAFDRILITGSPHSVLEREPWMLRVADYARAAAERHIPVLGVCFGHQLLAWAFGGEVRRHPSGREIGTVTCALTASGRSDPLFTGIPSPFAAQTTHEDVVVVPPAGAELLATNGFTTWQAFRVGPHVRAVQFHPEVDAATMRGMVQQRAAAIAAGAAALGLDPAERLRGLSAGIRATPSGTRLLRNFVRLPPTNEA